MVGTQAIEVVVVVAGDMVFRFLLLDPELRKVNPTSDSLVRAEIENRFYLDLRRCAGANSELFFIKSGTVDWENAGQPFSATIIKTKIPGSVYCWKCC